MARIHKVCTCIVKTFTDAGSEAHPIVTQVNITLNNICINMNVHIYIHNIYRACSCAQNLKFLYIESYNKQHASQSKRECSTGYKQQDSQSLIINKTKDVLEVTEFVHILDQHSGVFLVLGPSAGCRHNFLQFECLSLCCDSE